MRVRSYNYNPSPFIVHKFIILSYMFTDCTILFQVEIRKELSDVVKYEVDRSTHDDKLRDFHEWMKAVKKDTLHHVNY